MTTTVRVHVNGRYVAKVTQDDRPPVEVRHGEERSFNLPHPASSVFRIEERPEEQEPA